MYARCLTVIILILVAAPSIQADLPWNGPGPRPPRPTPDGVPNPPPQLVIERDPNATSATLILPRDLSAGLKPSDTSRFAKAAPNALVGLALFGSLIAGGLWLARLPRAKYLLGVMVPLLAFTIVGAAVQAQPAHLDAPRAIIEKGMIRVIRDGNAANIRLILPKKPATK